MFLVSCERAGRRWVSGVFRTRADAVSYVNEVPGELRAIQRIVEASPTEYPTYLVEGENGFVLHSPASLADLMADVQRVSDDEWCYFNVYRLTEDWRPPQAGTDYMGIIRHVHVENHHLDRARAGGIDALW